MPQPPPADQVSLLLLDECFVQADERFVETLRRVESPKFLAGLAERWKKDARPWARAQLLAYLEQPLDVPGHQPLVKRLYKEAEAKADHEVVAAFLVAFDTLVRRTRRKTWRYDLGARSGYEVEYLATPRDVLPREPRSSFFRPDGSRVTVGANGQRIQRGRLFTYRTRYYLRRRAWRYFRWLAYRSPAAYPQAVATALKRYRDADLATGENILDSWALLHICFEGSDALEFTPVHVRLKEGRALAELHAAPRFAEAWTTPEGARLLLDLVAQGQAQLVRLWAIELFRTVQAKVSIEMGTDQIRALLDHDDERVQQFGAALFESMPGIEKLPVATWLQLLETRNLTALATLTTAFKKHVTPERLSLEQCIALAVARSVPVARLGRELLSARRITPQELPALGGLANARCASVAGELATWTLLLVGTREWYEVNVVSRFFDSLVVETREAAWAWLLSGEPAAAAYNDPVLWSRLAETPFDELKLKLVDHLAVRVDAPAMSADKLAPVWCAVLLGVHRGGRQKVKAVHAIADAVAAAPESVEELLPVLAVAVRSVRGPEMRAGLGAVMSLVARRPELGEAVRARLPELKFANPEAAA